MRNDSLPMQDPGGLGIFLVMARALAPAPFQPDFRARWGRSDAVAPRSSPADEPGRASDPAAAEAKPAPRKVRFLERLDRWFWAQQQRDLEKYLAQSADVHDLEQRMRNIERSAWHRYN